MAATAERQATGNPYGLAIYDVTLTPGFAVVEHCIFCGKDLGYRIYVSPDRYESLASPGDHGYLLP